MAEAKRVGGEYATATKVAIGFAAAVAAGTLYYYLSTPSNPSSKQVPSSPFPSKRNEHTRVFISGLTVYPVKSLAGVSVQSSKLVAQGLKYDRKWIVVRESVGKDGETHEMLTQRQCPHMCLVQPIINEATGTLTLTLLPGAADSVAGEGNKGSGGVSAKLKAPAKASVTVPLNAEDSAPNVKLEVWGTPLTGKDCGNESAEWLSTVLDTRVRLVCAPEGFKRSVGEKEFVQHLNGEVRGGETENVFFADCYPYLFISEEQVQWLNEQADEASGHLEGARFRGNVTVRGTRSPHDIDSWGRIQAVGRRVGEEGSGGGVQLEFVKPCTRCIMPNVDPDAGIRTKEPGKTLERLRRAEVGGSVQKCFGQNAIQVLDNSSEEDRELFVGQEIVVLSRKAPLQFI